MSLGYDAVSVDVNGLYSAAIHDDLAASRTWLRSASPSLAHRIYGDG